MNAHSPPESPLRHFSDHKGRMTAQHYYWWATSDLDRVSDQALDETLEVFSKFPFAEDRMLNFARRVADRRRDLALRSLNGIVEKTGSFFWAYHCGCEALKLGDVALGRRALVRACELGDHTTVDYESNPITYDPSVGGSLGGERIQPSPGEIAEAAKLQLEQLG